MKTNITISEIVEKIGQKGNNFLSIRSNLGWINSFNSVANKELVKNLGKDVSVEMVDRNGFKNILAYYGTALEAVTESVMDEPANKFTEARQLKDASMLTSYIKDVIVAVLGSQTMLEPENRITVEKATEIGTTAILTAYTKVKEAV